jgi:hypothetical protein
MSIKSFTEFTLPKNSYTAFDATTIKELIITRLNESEVFRDQVYEGSNLNAFIDIVAYMYHVLLFYLNTTSSESTFTTAELYENINKLVSNLNYKPAGKQTSLVNISLSGSSGLAPNNYILRRFSTIASSGIPFTTIDDISFEKTTEVDETLSINNNTLYQGSITEHPKYTAVGENFEILTVVNLPDNTADSRFIADNSFTIFIKSIQSGKWQEWNETSSLFLEDSNALVYEKRLNENGNFEFKFGNGTNGKKLEEGDVVQIYYVFSSGSQGQIGSNVLLGNFFNLYNTSTFNEIVTDIYASTDNFIVGSNLSQLITNNTNDSSPISQAETIEQIKNNAPKIFSLQNRLVTATDYEYFINRSFNNVIKSVKILSNDEYVNELMRYYYSVGLNQPNEDCRVLFNQVNFSNSTSFNNVYVVSVPKISTIINEQIPNYLNASQKQLIINECNLKKDLTQNVVTIDPVYKAINLGLQIQGEVECVDLKDVTVLVIKKDPNIRISTNVIKNNVANIFKTYFDNIQLGQVVNTSSIVNEILNIDGVSSIVTRRTDTQFEVPILSLIAWNPSYPVDDISFTSQNIQLKKFEYAYFYDISKLTTKIIVEDE